MTHFGACRASICGMNRQITGRRKMIKNLVLGSGLILYPSLFFKGNNEQSVHIITVGATCNNFVEEFKISNPQIKCTGIGNTEGSSFIEYDFSFINMQIEKFDYALVKISENIKDVFSVQTKYIIVCNLNKPNALLSKSIIEYLQINSIDFRFLGTTPFFNPALGNWGKDYFIEFKDDPRLTIFDVNEYLMQLRQINGQILAVDAFEILNDELTDSLIGLINL